MSLITCSSTRFGPEVPKDEEDSSKGRQYSGRLTVSPNTALTAQVIKSCCPGECHEANRGEVQARISHVLNRADTDVKSSLPVELTKGTVGSEQIRDAVIEDGVETVEQLNLSIDDERRDISKLQVRRVSIHEFSNQACCKLLSSLVDPYRSSGCF